MMLSTHRTARAGDRHLRVRIHHILWSDHNPGDQRPGLVFDVHLLVGDRHADRRVLRPVAEANRCQPLPMGVVWRVSCSGVEEKVAWGAPDGVYRLCRTGYGNCGESHSVYFR